jgi:hypothetical protein
MLSYGLGIFDDLQFQDVQGVTQLQTEINPEVQSSLLINENVQELTETVKGTNRILSAKDKISVWGFFIGIISLIILLVKK